MCDYLSNEYKNQYFYVHYFTHLQYVFTLKNKKNIYTCGKSKFGTFLTASGKRNPKYETSTCLKLC